MGVNVTDGWRISTLNHFAAACMLVSRFPRLARLKAEGPDGAVLAISEQRRRVKRGQGD